MTKSPLRAGQANAFVEFLKTATIGELINKNPDAKLFSIPLNDRHETALHICARNNVMLIPYLLEHGANPRLVDYKKRTPLFFLLEHMLHVWVVPWADMRGVSSDNQKSRYFMLCMEAGTGMIERGVKANTLNSYGMNLLHLAVANMALLGPDITHRYVVRLLMLRVNPAIQCSESIIRGCDALAMHCHAMQLVNKRGNLSPAAFETAILLLNECHNSRKVFVPRLLDLASANEAFKTRFVPLIRLRGGEAKPVPDRFYQQSGSYSDSSFPYAPVVLKEIEVEPKSALDVKPDEYLAYLYRTYPGMRDFFIRQLIPETRLNDADYVFNKINYPDLRLEIIAQRGEQGNFRMIRLIVLLMVLAGDRYNQHSTSLNKKLPWDVVLMILKIHELQSKREEDLANTILRQFGSIREMLRLPGIICVEPKRLPKNRRGQEAEDPDDRSPVYEFSFYKSVESFAREYYRLPRDKSGAEARRNMRRQAMSIYGSNLTMRKTTNKQNELREHLKGADLYRGKLP